MKEVLIIVFFALCSSGAFAQSEISLSLGAAIPTGDFAATSGGAAKSGFMADMLYLQPSANNKLCLAAELRYQSNSLDVSGYNVTATNWRAINLLIGPAFKINLSSNATFEPRVLLGYMSATTPKLTVTSGGSSLTIPSTSGGAFATMFGANFKIKTSETSSFIMGVDYLSGNPKFTLSSGGSSQDVNQQINTLNISVGMAFKLI